MCYQSPDPLLDACCAPSRAPHHCPQPSFLCRHLPVHPAPALPFCQHHPTLLRSPLPKQDPLLLQQSHTEQNDGENSEDGGSAPGNHQWRCLAPQIIHLTHTARLSRQISVFGRGTTFAALVLKLHISCTSKGPFATTRQLLTYLALLLGCPQKAHPPALAKGTGTYRQGHSSRGTPR